MTGFNTEFKLSGRAYHVQTQDQGPLHPFFQTLVYARGEILDSFKGDYSDLPQDGPDAERELSRRMEEQHKRVVGYVKGGRYDVTPDWREMDYQSIFGGRPLEEAIMEYVREEGDIDVMELVLSKPLLPTFSSILALSLQARLCVSRAPVHGASVSVKLVSSLKKLFVLAEGATDREGNFAVSVDLPPSQPGNCTILVSCASEHGNDEIEAPITVRQGRRPARPMRQVL
jgi:hypothetical protein